MAVSYIPGVQTTGNILQAERQVDIPPRLFWLEKDISPLLHISAGGGVSGLPPKKMKAINPKFDVIEKEPHGAWASINDVGDYTAGAVTFTVDTSANLKVDDVLQCVDSTNEIVRVTEVTNGTTIEVAREQGTVSAGAIVDDTPLYLIGNMREEFSTLGNINMVKNRLRTNYLQIFDYVFGLSRTEKNSEMYQGKKKPELRQEAFIEIKKRIERAFLFGQPYESLTGGPNSRPIRATGGVTYWISSGGGYVQTVTVTYTRTMWTTALRNVFRYNSPGGENTKIALCSPLAIDMFNYWKDGKLELKPSDEFYNLKVAEWINGHGRVMLVRDPMLENSPVGSLAGYGGDIVLVDPPNLKYRFLQNSDLQFHENAVIAGQDGEYDLYRGELGLGLTNPETMGWVRNIATWS